MAVAGIGFGGPGAARPATRRPPFATTTVDTVLGPIDAAKLGYTLPHEHILAGSAGFFQNWPEAFGGRATFVAKVVAKLRAAKQAGVDTIVDVTPADVGRDIRLLQEVSRASGIQIVAATGHWLYPSLSMAARTTEEIADFFRLEIERGIDGTGIKPGVIKVATDHDGVTPFIDKTLRAAARTSKATGVPITTHTLAAERTAEKQAAIFEAEGLDPARVCLGHADDSGDLDYLLGLVRRGYTIGMDHLSWSARAADSGPGAAIATLAKRGDTIMALIDAGFVERLFLSNDWYFGLSIAPTGAMESLDRLNPDGMLFSTRKLVPYLEAHGVSRRAIRTMTVDNPRRLFGRTRPG